jgi:hypothetical protein
MKRHRSNSIPRGKIDHVDPICVECGGRAKLVDGRAVHPENPARHGQMFWRCSCGAFVGCHPRTGVAVGRPASGRTRYLRIIAHKALDAFWRRGERTAMAAGFARKRAYKWLARELGQRVEETHIGWMDAADCQRVIDLCQARAQGGAS